MITLWGPSSSGKTALLSYLFLRSQAVKSIWHVFPADQQTTEEVKRQSGLILRKNEFPVGTMITNEKEIGYHFRKEGTEEVFALKTKDRAGGRSETMDAELLKSLVDAEGIVLFLDYARGNRETEVIETLTQLHGSYSEKKGTVAQKDPRPLAVCLSKADQMIREPRDVRRLSENPEQFVRDYLTAELQGWIDQFHSKVKFFPVSSVGVRLSYGSVQKSVFFDERMVLRVTKRGTPINIMEPFIWIFEQIAEHK